jgi:hypothetical protein
VRNHSKQFKPFVANHVAEIQRTTSLETCPRNTKPSRFGTRGLSATELADSTFWLEGPLFLRDNESVWPSTPSRPTTVSDRGEMRATQMYLGTVTNVSLEIDPNNFSSFHRQLKSKNKEYIRPIHRLCPLEYIDEGEDSEQ